MLLFGVHPLEFPNYALKFLLCILYPMHVLQRGACKQRYMYL